MSYLLACYTVTSRRDCPETGLGGRECVWADRRRDATPHPLSNQPQFLLIVPDLLSLPPDPVLGVWSLSLCHVGVHFCRDAGQEEHNHVLVLSRAVRGHHVYDTDPTEDAVLFFQSHRALCTDLIDGAARIHTATGLRRKINFR